MKNLFIYLFLIEVHLFFSQLVWALASNETERQGIAIDYPLLTMHGIVTHDPKYPEEHLVVVVQKPKEEEEDDNDDSKFIKFRKTKIDFCFILRYNKSSRKW